MVNTKDDILDRIKETLQTVAPEAKAILFGSRARGDDRKDSDWDILILIDKERVENEDFDKIAYPLIELGWSMGEAINPKLYTMKEWLKRNFTPFFHNVKKGSSDKCVASSIQERKEAKSFIFQPRMTQIFNPFE